jgi:AraC-like DNA-binding protein
MTWGRIDVRPRLRGLSEVGIGLQLFDRYQRPASHELHSHDIVELNAIIDGRGEYLFPGRRLSTGPGCLGIVHYGQAHDIRTGPEGMTVINLYLDLDRRPLPSLGGELQAQIDHILPQRPSLRHRRTRFVHLTFPDGQGPEPILRAMLAEQDARRPGWLEALSSHLRLLLIAMARTAGTAVEPLPDRRGDAALAALVARIEDDPAGDHDLDRLAARAGLTRSSLCRAFRRFAGIPPMAFVARARAVRAADLIRSGMAVTDAAISAGFRDRSTCYRALRRLRAGG